MTFAFVLFSIQPKWFGGVTVWRRPPPFSKNINAATKGDATMRKPTKPSVKTCRENFGGLYGLIPNPAPQTYVLITNDMSIKEIIDRLIDNTDHRYLQ
jgi:hypothetical protein